jgi:hypothetical protein
VDFSNRKSLTVSGMLGGGGLIAGSIAGHLGIATGLLMLLIFVPWFGYLQMKGPGDVAVRFGDSDHLFALDKLRISRTINLYFLYLRRLGLNPPLVSPIINVGGRHDTPYSVGCAAHGSKMPDHFELHRSQISKREVVAWSYSWCFFRQSFKALAFLESSSGIMYSFLSLAQHIVSDYFPKAFAGIKIGDYASPSDVSVWVAALLNIRVTCGAHFTDSVIAYLTLQLSEAKDGVYGQDFNMWFFSHLRDAIFAIRLPGDRRKFIEVANILVERGLLPRGIQI